MTKSTKLDEKLDFNVGDLVINTGSGDIINDKEGEVVVLVSMAHLNSDADIFHGVVVWAAEGSGMFPGYRPGRWVKKAFRPFKGKVILEG